jgi:hypothetical protein
VDPSILISKLKVQSQNILNRSKFKYTKTKYKVQLCYKQSIIYKYTKTKIQSTNILKKQGVQVYTKISATTLKTKIIQMHVYYENEEQGY